MIVEIRVPMPLKTEEFNRGWLYMVVAASEENSGGDDGAGVVVLKNEPYDNTDGHMGTSELSGYEVPKNKGQYTLKQYFLGSRVPGWLRFILPGDLFFLYEEAWNAYPDCLTILTSKYFANTRLRIIVRTLFKDDSKGDEENPHELTEQELKERKIYLLDIMEQDKEDKDYAEKYDPVGYKSELTGRGPLGKDWMETTKPVMCCYKLIKADVKIWGIQTKTENTIINAQRKLFLRTHGQAFTMLDEYYPMSMDDIRTLENAAQKKLETLSPEKNQKKKPAKDDKSGNSEEGNGLKVTAKAST
jgi:hypothetical protein